MKEETADQRQERLLSQKHIKVRATKEGYYNLLRRRAGSVFMLVPGQVRDLKKTAEGVHVGYEAEREMTAREQFSKRWMELVDSDEEPMEEAVQKKIEAVESKARGGRKVI